MILKHLKIHNFGIYGDTPVLQLESRTDEQFNRPIVLFSGKNGVGKTTFLEAIRICLHGTLALGPRISRKQYEEFLIRKVHRRFKEELDASPKEMSILLAFDYVSAGKLFAYEVKRSWQVANAKDINERLQIWENGSLLTAIQPDQYESFLRELIPPSTTDLFFFDGEKIEQLTKAENSKILLGDAIKSLLGIHLVEQLQKDLEVFIARQSEMEDSGYLHDVLLEMQQESTTLLANRTELLERQQMNSDSATSIQMAIQQQEQKIASQGGNYAKRFGHLKQEKLRLEREIDQQSRRLQEMCSGLFPFAIAPRTLHRIAQRLGLEQAFHQWKVSQEILNNQLVNLRTEIESADFWSEFDLALPVSVRVGLFEKLCKKLNNPPFERAVAPEEVIHCLSEHEQVKLITWIEQALKEIPLLFSSAANELIKQQEELRKVTYEMEKTPADLILQPLIDTLHQLIKEKEELQKAGESYAKDLGILEFKIGQTQARIKNVAEEIRAKKRNQKQIELAIKSSQALKAYTEELTRKKIDLLEVQLVKRFSELVRKIAFVDRVSIDIDTFQISLYRHGNLFSHEQLSAGEKQLLAVATIWALRDISGIPMPVIVDTPLGRLDSDHRLNMVQDYFPRASHQVILLATDTEVDQAMIAELAPAISHGYQMDLDVAHTNTIISDLILETEPEEVTENNQ